MSKNRRKDGPREVIQSDLRELVMDASIEVGTSLWELVITGGLKVFGKLVEDDLEMLCGEKHERTSSRTAYRHGSEQVAISFGGRKILFNKPRLRDLDGKREVTLPIWEKLRKEDLLSQRAVEQILSGVTTRKYSRSIENMPESVEVRGTSKSSVSRRFVARTQAEVKGFLSRPLDDDDYPVVFIDGTGLGDHVVLVALGVTRDGSKRVLGCVEGSTENAVVCKTLLSSLVDRGMEVSKHRLFVIDGAKALRKAVKGTFTKWAQIQRCQEHKKRNILGHLPEVKHQWVGRKLQDAWCSQSPEEAKQTLESLAASLDEQHPQAAASILEGLDETLTVLHLGTQGALFRTLRSTNPIENLQGSIKWTVKNVRRWRSGSMVLRWTVTALMEAENQFRRVKGLRDLPALVRALESPIGVPSVDAESDVA